jgi:hypothetical protein
MRDNAFKWLTANYIADYAPMTTQEKTSSSSQEAPPAKVRKLASDTFLDDDEDDEMDEEEELEVPTKKSEVEEYLLLSQIPFTMAFVLLDWWRTRSAMWPNLSRMARQFLALPATSGGVERIFSAGGVMNGDLRKRLKEETLSLQLFVNKNG